MGLFEHWPYVNFHEMNLDWIIKEIPKVFAAKDEAQASAEASAESAEASQLSADASQLSADASQQSADASQQSADSSQESAENAAESEASAKNYADHIGDPVAGLVTDWLDDHVTPTTPSVDDTLTISGAAADSKKVGDKITDLKSALTTGYDEITELVNGNYNRDGSTTTGQANRIRTNLIPFSAGQSIIINCGTLRYSFTMWEGTPSEASVKTHYTEALTNNIVLNPNYNGNIIIIFSKTDNGNLTPSDFDGDIKKTTDLTLFADVSHYVVNQQDNGIDISAINFIDYETSPNLFNIDQMNIGYVITNSGEKSYTSYYATSDYIEVSPGDIIRATPLTDNADTTFALYNSSKEWVTGTRWTQTVESNCLKITIPIGIKYITVNIKTQNADDVVIVKNQEYDSDYAGEYGTNISLKDGYYYKSKLLNKLIAYNGDSICESRIVSGTANNGGAYAYIISKLTGAKYDNRAISGGILASAVPTGETMPQRSVVSDVTNMPDDADLICFEGGINDYWKNVPLGDYSESDYSGTLDTTTVCGALESIFRQATTKWVGKPIVFVIVHKIKSTVYVANSAGYTFAQARDKMIGICNKYAIPYYDAFAESGLNAYNDIQNTTFLTSNSTGNPDGCHPNESAYRRYYVPQLIALFESVMPRLDE